MMTGMCIGVHSRIQARRATTMRNRIRSMPYPSCHLR